jgi:hypothetical protein
MVKHLIEHVILMRTWFVIHRPVAVHLFMQVRGGSELATDPPVLYRGSGRLLGLVVGAPLA